MAPPPPGLSIAVGDIALVTPDERVLQSLQGLIVNGVHPPSYQPFTVPWTDADPVDAARSYGAWVRRQQARSTPDSWTLCFAAVRDGVVVGAKSLSAAGFAVRREVSTGSWLGLDYQSRGIGTLMRHAVLDLAFRELHADWAVSTAYADNPASCRVNEKLGYVRDGFDIVVRRGSAARLNRYRLPKEVWLAAARERADVAGPAGWSEWFQVPGK